MLIGGVIGLVAPFILVSQILIVGNSQVGKVAPLVSNPSVWVSVRRGRLMVSRVACIMKGFGKAGIIPSLFRFHYAAAGTGNDFIPRLTESVQGALSGVGG